MENQKTKISKNDIIEIIYTGYSDGKIFDSNIKEDLEKLDKNAKTQPTKIILGQGMIVPGLDKEMEGKEIGKEYQVEIKSKDAFGDRKRDLVKTIPLRIFTDKQINPYPGLVLSMDDSLAKVITVSGARVVTDFNNPLAGKDLKYKYTILRKIDEINEKCKTLFELLFRIVPEFEIKGEDVIVKAQKEFDFFVTAFKDKFKEFSGKNLKFELKEVKDEKKDNKKEGNENKKEAKVSDNKPAQEAQNSKPKKTNNSENSK